MRKRILLILIFTSQFSISQTFNVAKLDSLINQVEKKNLAMGSVSIFQGEKEVYSKSFGFVDLDKKKPLDANSVYRVGSINKMFTASILLDLIAKDSISLSTPLSLYYPDIANAQEITIEQMLRHRSGIHNFLIDTTFIPIFDQYISRDYLLKKFKSYPSDFTPNTQAAYSNTNFVLLGFIIEDILGKRYEQILNDWLKSNGLFHSYYGAHIDSHYNEAFSYHWKEGWQLNTEANISLVRAAGGLVSTPMDLNHYLVKLLRNKGILSQDYVALMTNYVDGFGMGLMEDHIEIHRGIGHTGVIDGFYSHTFYYPTDDVSISLCTNAINLNISHLWAAIAKIYFNIPVQFPN